MLRECASDRLLALSPSITVAFPGIPVDPSTRVDSPGPAFVSVSERDDRRGYVERARPVATARAVSNSFAVALGLLLARALDGDQRFGDGALGLSIDQDLGGEERASVNGVCRCGDR